MQQVGTKKKKIKCFFLFSRVVRRQKVWRLSSVIVSVRVVSASSSPSVVCEKKKERQ